MRGLFDREPGLRARRDGGELVDATPAREHIAALQAFGWTINGLARALGYHPNTVRAIAKGWSVQTRDTTEADILSVRVPTINPRKDTA